MFIARRAGIAVPVKAPVFDASENEAQPPQTYVPTLVCWEEVAKAYTRACATNTVADAVFAFEKLRAHMESGIPVSIGGVDCEDFNAAFADAIRASRSGDFDEEVHPKAIVEAFRILEAERSKPIDVVQDRKPYDGFRGRTVNPQEGDVISTNNLRASYTCDGNRVVELAEDYSFVVEAALETYVPKGGKIVLSHTTILLRPIRVSSGNVTYDPAFKQIYAIIGQGHNVNGVRVVAQVKRLWIGLE